MRQVDGKAASLSMPMWHHHILWNWYWNIDSIRAPITWIGIINILTTLMMWWWFLSSIEPHFQAHNSSSCIIATKSSPCCVQPSGRGRRRGRRPPWQWMAVNAVMAIMVLEYREVSRNIILVSTIIPPLIPDTHHPSYNPPVLSSTLQVPTLHHYLDIFFKAAVICDHLGLMRVVPLKFNLIKYRSGSDDFPIWSMERKGSLPPILQVSKCNVHIY